MMHTKEDTIKCADELVTYLKSLTDSPEKLLDLIEQYELSKDLYSTKYKDRYYPEGAWRSLSSAYTLLANVIVRDPTKAQEYIREAREFPPERLKDVFEKDLDEATEMLNRMSVEEYSRAGQSLFARYVYNEVSISEKEND
jgi:hypothetical protein